MELGPPSWKTLVVFSCRLLHKLHEIQHPKLYVCQKSERPPILEIELETNNGQNYLKLYRY